MYQYDKMLFLGKSIKKNKKESIEYLNKTALDGHQKSEDFLTAYQLLYSCKGFKSLSVDHQYFFISNVMNNYLKNRENMMEEDSIRIDHINISPKESEKIITRNFMKSHTFQSFLLSFQDVSFETIFPSQSIKQLIWLLKS